MAVEYGLVTGKGKSGGTALDKVLIRRFWSEAWLLLEGTRIHRGRFRMG